MTEEEAKTQLEELGIDQSMRGFKGPGKFEQLDEETQAKVNEIHVQVKEGKLTEEEAKAELEKLGISFPDKREMNSL
ncbi:hypothetical protein [Alkalihalobacillus deserti]|uniref:hypothetical protein n=1 Tax=Alkalihalobacillus deserti TaxID=2879466 RepID=UPI001D15C535|nr:hypothetical protein [Alkalihalobacillus deserti]